MSRAEITMKSGAAITFECTKLVTRRNTVSGGLVEIEWDGAVGAPMYLDLSEVAAVAFRAAQS